MINVISIDGIICLSTLLVCSFLTTLSGVGGGGLLLPILILIGKFDILEAVPLTVVTILGNTVVRMILLWRKTHPDTDKRYVIDLTPVMLMNVFDSNTSYFGVILSKILPPVFNVFFIILILGLALYNSIKKGIQKYKKENELKSINETCDTIVIDGIGIQLCEKDVNDAIHYDYQRETKAQRLVQVLIIIITFLIVSLFTFTRDEFETCSNSWIYHYVGQITCLFVLGIIIIFVLINSYKNKKFEKFMFVEGDLKWEADMALKLSIIASFTGFMSTYLGIGGGMLTSPILLYYGMRPEVMVATGSVSTFLSSLVSCFVYMTADRIIWAWAFPCLLIGSVSSVLGMTASDYFIKKYNRTSFIIFMLCGILATSMILLTINGVNNVETDGFIFGNFCN
jgi:uncharacterized membrane protein YfcA